VRFKDAGRYILEAIHEAESLQENLIMILHGKGEGGNPPALLKSYVNHWLPQIDAVLAFHSTPLNRGGYGATYVLLRTNKELGMR
jgi:DNA-nicking Smr family endonuclease